MLNFVVVMWQNMKNLSEYKYFESTVSEKDFGLRC